MNKISISVFVGQIPSYLSGRPVWGHMRQNVYRRFYPVVFFLFPISLSLSNVVRCRICHLIFWLTLVRGRQIWVLAFVFLSLVVVFFCVLSCVFFLHC